MYNYIHTFDDILGYTRQVDMDVNVSESGGPGQGHEYTLRHIPSTPHSSQPSCIVVFMLYSFVVLSLKCCVPIS